LRCCGAPRQQADGGALHIALAARDLPRKPQARLTAQAQLGVEQLGAVDEGVAMETAQPRKLGPLQARNGAEHAPLLAMFEFGLEAHHVPKRSQRVVLAQLHHRVGALARHVRISEANRLHWPVP